MTFIQLGLLIFILLGIELYSIFLLFFRDYLLVGADDTKLRLYDVNTLSGYLIPETHRDSINSVRWSKNANLYASTSKDGDIRIYDGVTNECIRVFNLRILSFI